MMGDRSTTKRTNPTPASILLGIEKAAHHSRTGTVTVKVALDELFITAIGALYGQGFIKFESFEADKDFNAVVYYGTKVTLKGRVWYALLTFSILRMDDERDSLIEGDRTDTR